MRIGVVAYASVFGAMMVAGVASPALAASPAYCALYAREYAVARIGAVTSDQSASASKRVEDQAYFRCLNLDEEPEFPSSSAYAGASVEDLDGGASGPFQDIAEGDTDTNDDADIAPATPAKPSPPTVMTTASIAPPKPVVAASGAAQLAIAVPAALGTAVAKDAPPSDAAYASGAKLKATSLIAWSPEWLSWCKSHFPHSFDSQTGFVVPVGAPKRFCGA
jgi:hypothetical protein